MPAAISLKAHILCFEQRCKALSHLGCIGMLPELSWWSKAKTPQLCATAVEDNPQAASTPALYAAQVRLQQKLNIIEEVRADLEEAGIDVPGVVVCGDQSTGKSSVLTSLTGITFPRAEETCTRCPIIVRLQPDPRCRQDYAVIGMDPSLDVKRGFPHAKRVHSIGEVGTFIEQLTRPLKARGIEGFSDHSTFTLIDLPGIIRVAVDGIDADVAAITTGLVVRHIKDKMVILVVVPANSDPQTAEAFRLARAADPDGRRTLGVVTKIDKYDTEKIVDRVEGRGSIKLKLGFVAVRNRTQQEIREGVTLEEARQLEARLFEHDPVLSRISKDRVGLDALSRRIADLQGQVIDNAIPSMIEALESRVKALQDDLAALGKPCVTYEECFMALTQILNRAAARLRGSMKGCSALEDDGSGTDSSEEQSGEDDDGGVIVARRGKTDTICALVHDAACDMAAALRADMPDFLTGRMANRVMKEMRKYRGSALPNLNGNPVVQQLTRKYLEPALHTRSEEFLQRVVSIVRGPSLQVLTRESVSYPRARERLSTEMAQLLEEQAARVRAVLRVLVDAERQHVGTLDGSYTDTVTRIRTTLLAAHESMTHTSTSHISHLTAEQGQIKAKPVDDDVIDPVAPRTVRDALPIGSSDDKQAVVDHQVSLHVYTKLVLTSFTDTAFKVTRSIFFQGLHGTLVQKLLERVAADPARLLEMMHEDEDMASGREDKERQLSTFLSHLSKLREAC